MQLLHIPYLFSPNSVLCTLIQQFYQKNVKFFHKEVFELYMLINKTSIKIYIDKFINQEITNTKISHHNLIKNRNNLKTTSYLIVRIVVQNKIYDNDQIQYEKQYNNQKGQAQYFIKICQYCLNDNGQADSLFIYFIFFVQSVQLLEQIRNSTNQIIGNIGTMKYNSMKQHIFLKGNERKILQMLQKSDNIDYIDLVDQKNNTPLHYAVSLRYDTAVKHYLDLLKSKELWCKKLQQQSVSNSVVSYKAKMWINAQNNQGMTALHYASLQGNVKAMKILQHAGARLDKITKTGLNICTLAAQEGKLQSLIYLRGKFNINLKDANGCTPLHWACYRGHKQIVKYLINQSSIQLNFRDNQGRTALHLATIYSHPKIVQILLLAGSSRLIKDKHNKLAEDYANNEKIYEMLTLKQKWRCHPRYQYSPRKPQGFAIIVLLFIFSLLLILGNYLFDSEPLIYKSIKNNKKPDWFWETTSEFIFGYVCLIVEVLTCLTVFAFAISLHFSDPSSRYFSSLTISQLQQSVDLSENYCFQCQKIEQQGTKHCLFCHRCIPLKLMHCNGLGCCIGQHNRYRYYALLLVLIFFMVLEVIRGISLLNYILKETVSMNFWDFLKTFLAIFDLFCFFLAIVALSFLIKAVKIFHKLNQFLIIKKFSETTLDSRSTLIAQKLKKASIGSPMNVEKLNKRKKNFLNTRKMDEAQHYQNLIQK